MLNVTSGGEKTNYGDSLIEKNKTILKKDSLHI